jgi:hypothetical protein
VPVRDGAVLVMLQQVPALELQHLLDAHLRNFQLPATCILKPLTPLFCNSWVV